MLAVANRDERRGNPSRSRRPAATAYRRPESDGDDVDVQTSGHRERLDVVTRLP